MREDLIPYEHVIQHGEFIEQVFLHEAQLLCVAIQQEKQLGLKCVRSHIPVEAVEKRIIFHTFFHQTAAQ